MATNVLFDFFTESIEQELLSDLVQEAIQISGHDCWYVPRTVENRDALFTEAEYHSFNSAYFLEFYVKTTSQMGGEGALLSKFNVELRDELVLTVAKKTFQEEVLDSRPDILRPREGDLVFIPMIGAMFTVTYVDKKAFFYQLGDLQAYDMTLELYEGTSAVFATGVPLIDAIYQPITVDVHSFALTTEDGFELHDDGEDWILLYQTAEDQIDNSQNVVIEDEADTIIDWTETDPFSEGGTF